ncbi:MAG: hypothetical protein K9I34_03405, partial [Bacteroidales bacterium]|nr:hypothetical protein [Bacteroidales bacterium]
MKKELVFESIKWSDKSPEEIYQYFAKLDAPEQLKLLKLLCQRYPDIEIDWLDIFEELRFHLSYADNISACEEFVQWFPEYHHEEYARGYEFIERDLCDYYLKIWDLENLRQRIGFISQHPVSGIDTITIRLYFQLLYHGLYEDAINYAAEV